jgi:hypothetical protein
MDYNNRTLYKLPTIAEILGEPDFPYEVHCCKRLGPIIVDFVEQKTALFHWRLINEFPQSTAQIWNNKERSVLERLQNLKDYIKGFEEIARDAFASAFVALKIQKKCLESKRDIIYSFCDEHDGGDMNSPWAIVVEAAIDNYVEPTWPAEIANNLAARIHALSVLVVHMGAIEERLGIEYREIKRLILCGY